MCRHVRAADPRKAYPDGSFSCVKCGRRVAEGLRDRDPAFERRMVQLAARSAGVERAAESLSAFADARAWPGGVRVNMDSTREASEEIADCRSYLVWGIERVYAGVVAGDPGACDEYERLMRALGCVVAAWQALHTPSA